jgi:hypothetical protein
MRSRRRSWLSGIGAGVLIWGLLLAGSGPEVASAASPTTEEIIAKADQILTALGGIKDGNHTLRWDQNLPAAQRFVILPAFNEAVLDKNTGLVWEQAPDATERVWQHTSPPLGALEHRLNRRVGGTVGWRLPSVVELKGVQDDSAVAPFVPIVVFPTVQSARYWSATTVQTASDFAWHVHFSYGSVNSSNKAAGIRAWCVRCGMNADQY